MINEFNKILSVAKYTFYEIYKSKIMLAMLFWGFILSVLTYAATELTYGIPQKMAISFGMGFLSVSTLAISIFYGSYIISSEIQNNTFFMVLSRPIKRSSFLLGKIIGVKLILALNVTFWGILTSSLYFLFGGNLNILLVESIFFVFLQSLILLLFVVLFSLLVNISLSVVCTISVYICSYMVGGIIDYGYVERRVVLKKILQFIYFLLPDFSLLNLKDYLLYKTEVPFSYIAKAGSYGVIYCLLLYATIIYIFSRKSFE